MHAPHRPLRRALLFINPRASRTASPFGDALAALESGGISLFEPEVGTQGDLAAAIRAHAGDADLVIIGGGDGTLNGAAPALVETGLPLGVLPLGTANDFARTLDLPSDPAQAARIILAGERKAIDLGEVNGRLFFNVASVGFSVKLARHLTAEEKRRWGKLGYALVAGRVLRDSRPFRARIEHDGVQEDVWTMQISVGNGRHHGGGMTVDANATPDDGLFDIYSLEVPHWWHLIRLFPAMRRGTQGRSKHVRTFRTDALTIRTRRPRDVNADGEIVTTTPAVFRIRRRAVSVFAPGA